MNKVNDMQDALILLRTCLHYFNVPADDISDEDLLSLEFSKVMGVPLDYEPLRELLGDDYKITRYFSSPLSSQPVDYLEFVHLPSKSILKFDLDSHAVIAYLTYFKVGKNTNELAH